MQKRIYAADDEQNIRNLVKSFLEREGYEVETFENGDLLLDAFEKRPADLVILDIMMPGSDGLSVCAKLRGTSTVPIIMLTARDTDADYIVGITLGSDDYLTKPFSPIALTMRVKSIFRRIELEKRGASEDNRELVFADVKLSMGAKTVWVAGQGVDLTPNEFSLMAYLMEHQGRAVSRVELLDKLWGFDTAVETRVADDTVKRLRKKLSGSRALVDTVWGYGFRLKERG